MSIEDAIIEMLMENTGRAMCDSGDHYGRQWERNQKQGVDAIKNAPAFSVESFNEHEGSIRCTTYHYLTKHLDVTPVSEELQRDWAEFAKKSEYDYTSWLTIMKDFLDTRDDLSYNDSSVINTYNFENIIDQVLQYRIFFKHKEKKDDECYILLQIHNGCDVRGGYTAPRVFRVCDLDEFICYMNDLSLWSPKKELDIHFWSDDTGYHWYSDNHQYNPENLVFKDDQVFYKMPDGTLEPLEAGGA